MEVQRSETGWQPEIKVYRPRLRKTVTFIKDRSEQATVLTASLALGTDIVALFTPWVWPIGLLLSAVTLLAALVVVTRVVTVEAEMTGTAAVTAKCTVIKHCPECGEQLDQNPDSCANCGWESDDPTNE